MRAARIVAGLAAFAVGLAVAPGHPALRGGTPLEGTGRDLAAAASGSLRALGTLGAVDSGAPLAAAVLAVSVIVAAAVGIARLAGPAPEAPAGEPGAAGALVPGAALAGHAAGLAAAAAGAGGAAFYGWTGGVAAAALFAFARGPAEPGAAAARAGAARLAGILLLGALLFLAAGAVDGVLHARLRSRPFPEAWFTVAVNSGAGWLALPVLVPLAAAAAAAWGTERALDGRGAGGPARIAAAALGWALLLGPSNPARALALALAQSGLARAGAPPLARAAFAVALVVGMALAIHAV